MVSELRKTVPNPNVLAWHQSQAKVEAYVSVLVIGEIRQGIERARPRDPKQAEALERWLAGLASIYRDRVLPITVDIAEEWGRMNVSPQRPPIVDGLMAATARVHELTLVTRNVADVAMTGVSVLNPFESA